MKRTLCSALALLLLCAAITLPAAAAEEKTLPSGLAYSELAGAIEDFAAGHEDAAPGAAVAVFDRDGVVYENWFGYADAENGVPMTEDTVLEWGSVTKLTVWVGAMQLWEQGKLDLEADVRTYLPEGFLQNLQYDTPVTMLNLMNHTPGFEDSIFGMMTSDEAAILPLEDYLRTNQPAQIFEPGTVMAYSNWGAALAGYIVERVSGMPFYQYAQEHIFAPLGMEHTAINADLSDNSWVKQQRAKLATYQAPGSPIAKMGYIVMYPAGMCTSTLDDFIAFGRALLDPDSLLFESPETWEALFTPTAYYGDTDLPMNYHGFWREDSIFPGCVWHNGNTAGCASAFILNLDAGVGTAVMTNIYAEQAFNLELPQLVFGEGEGALYGGPIPDGFAFFETARSNFTGPLKIRRLFSIAPASDAALDVTAAYTESHGIPRLSEVSVDLLARGPGEALSLYGSAALWIASVLFCAVSLIIGLIRLLRKKKPSAWSGAVCALVLLPMVILIPAFLSLSGMQQWPMGGYRLWCIVNGLDALALLAAGVLGALRMKRDCPARRQRVYRILLLVAVAAAVWNICYWNLFMFWKIP